MATIESSVDQKTDIRTTRQFSTFFVSGRRYGIDVAAVQEVTKSMPITAVPQAPIYIHGLINLRGQIATAIGLRELFGLVKSEDQELMNVVCREDGNLISLLVDRIGDVVEIDQDAFEPTPDTVSSRVAQFMQGVYKFPDDLLSVLDVKKVLGILNEDSNQNSNQIK